MPVEIFTVEQFQAAMPPKAICLGIVQGEYTWAIPMPHPKVRMIVRSSIDSSKRSADCGEDSIRLWLEGFDGQSWYSLGQKPDAYTTRVKGWQDRLKNKIREVAKVAVKVRGDIPDCVRFNFVKKEGKNQGRPFYNNESQFVWLDF